MLPATYGSIATYETFLSETDHQPWMDGWMDGWIDESMDGWMDRISPIHIHFNNNISTNLPFAIVI